MINTLRIGENYSARFEESRSAVDTDFQQITRSRSQAGPVATQPTLERISLDLLRPLFPPPRGVRLLGVTLSSLEAKGCTGHWR